MRPVLIALFLSLASAVPLFAQGDGESLEFDMRARENLFFGTGVESGKQYYDIPITEHPTEGVLIKLPYTQKGGTLTFDVHHRVGRSQNFGLPAELMMVFEVVTGGANILGRFTMLHDIALDTMPVEPIDRASEEEIDRYVSPLMIRTVTIKTDPGPQSISLVGKNLNITREGRALVVDTPGTRIAMVSNIQFEETREGTTLEFETDPQ
jgi:hypothetical protein